MKCATVTSKRPSGNARGRRHDNAPRWGVVVQCANHPGLARAPSSEAQQAQGRSSSATAGSKPLVGKPSPQMMTDTELLRVQFGCSLCGHCPYGGIRRQQQRSTPGTHVEGTCREHHLRPSRAAACKLHAHVRMLACKGCVGVRLPRLTQGGKLPARHRGGDGTVPAGERGSTGGALVQGRLRLQLDDRAHLRRFAQP